MTDMTTPRSRLPRAPASLATVVSPILLLGLWELAARVHWIDARIMPPPTAVVGELNRLIVTGVIWPNLGYTTARFIAGTVLGVVPGTLLGMAMGLSSRTRQALEPLVMLIYPLPRIALFPLMLMVVGLNERANVLMIALGPFFTMLISTMAGVVGVDPLYKDVALSFKTKPADLYLKVMLPAALPAVLSGLQISLGLALMTTTAVEFLNADVGLGYLIWHSWQILSIKMSLACLIASGLIGAIFYALFRQLERRLLAWQSPSH